MRKYGACFLLFGLFSVLIVTPTSLFSQGNSPPVNQTDFHYLKFKSQFESELGLQDISDLEETPSNINQVFSQTELPEWVFNLPNSNQSVMYAIGVSDPGMSADSAHQLAVLRTKVILALMNNSKISGLNDYYISEKDLKSGEIISSVYREYSKIASTLTFNNTDFAVEEEVYTNNGEAIILASLHKNNPHSDDTTTINCLAEVSVSHVKRNNKHSTTSRTELMGDEKGKLKNLSNYFYYVVKNNNKQIKMISYFTGVTLPGCSDIITYKSNSTQTNTNDTTKLSCTLQYGLWYAYSYLTLQKIVLDFKDSNVNLSSLTDQHTLVNQNINRVLINKVLSFKIGSLEISNNKLYLDLDHLTQN